MVEVIAEFGQSHRGDLATAIRQADVAKQAGCTWVKWQTFQPERLCSPNAGRYWEQSLGGSETQLETFHVNGMLAPEGWATLADYCHSIGIGFMSSPFDLEAVDTLVDAGAGALKIASGEITHRQLLQKVADTGKKVFLSTGAATEDELKRALSWLHPAEVTVMACTLAYPTGDGDANLARIETLRKACFNSVGYSDHTLRVDTALAAAAMGATVLEKHCTLDTAGGVPDDLMALDPGRLRQYVTYAQVGARMRGDGMLGASDAEMAARVGARRSLHAARFMAEGHVFGMDDLVCLRPGGPFAPADVDVLVGKTATKDIPAGKQIESSDVAF